MSQMLQVVYLPNSSNAEATTASIAAAEMQFYQTMAVPIDSSYLDAA